ncbi:MAG: lipocalin family protein [Phycisphaerales bacterium]|nr:lipocalin family protein [Phycisphaerales bacterium]MCB9863140.1 lipocalin family protein [Phycisphaerales bacterium]
MRKSKQIMMAGFALWLAGCSVEGKWSLADVEPTAARRDFEFESLTLQEDGTFYAESRGPNGVETSSGTYTFGDDTLNLEAHSGERHTYNTKFITAGRLQLQGFWNGRRVYAEFDRKARSVAG